jgi:hypothetical protein
MTSSRTKDELINDVLSLFPRLDRFMAETVVNLHLKCVNEFGSEDYNAEKVAENIISAYGNEADTPHPLEISE